MAAAEEDCEVEFSDCVDTCKSKRDECVDKVPTKKTRKYFAVMEAEREKREYEEKVIKREKAALKRKKEKVREAKKKEEEEMIANGTLAIENATMIDAGDKNGTDTTATTLVSSFRSTSAKLFNEAEDYERAVRESEDNVAMKKGADKVATLNAVVWGTEEDLANSPPDSAATV